MEQKIEEDFCAFDDSYENTSGNQKIQLVWFNVYWYIVLHSLAIYGFYLLFHLSLPSILFFLFTYTITGLGITAGAHRLWTHRSYRAKLPLQIILCIFNAMAGQNSAIEWCRDHRVHHKYSETHADPHNAKRGFFFAHMGWLMCRKHSEVKTKGKNISIKDLENNSILKFQKKYYIYMTLLFNVILPTFIPTLWGDSAWNGFFVPFILRYVLVLHATWLVNSLAHLVGNKPYDHKINPAESLFVCFFAVGEGFHNYHHTFPHDYSTSEFGIVFNLTTVFINFMARIGWAYDLKKVSKQAIKSRKLRTGDGTPNIFIPFKIFKSPKVALDEIAEGDGAEEKEIIEYKKSKVSLDAADEVQTQVLLRHRPTGLLSNLKNLEDKVEYSDSHLDQGMERVMGDSETLVLKDLSENRDQTLLQRQPFEQLEGDTETIKALEGMPPLNNIAVTAASVEGSSACSISSPPMYLNCGSDLLKSLGAAAKDANIGSLVDRFFSFSPTVAAESVESYARESFKAAVLGHRRSLSASFESFENVGRGYFESTTNYFARQLSINNKGSSEDASLKGLNAVTQGLSSSFDCLNPSIIKVGNGF